MGPVNRRIVKWVLRVIERPRTTLAIAAVMLALSVFLAARFLPVSTDENKLFSAKVRFFRQYLTFIHKFPENEAAFVAVQARDPAHTPPTEQWVELARAITQSLRKLPEVSSVDSRVPLGELGAQSLLFADWSVVHKAVKQAPALAQLGRVWSGTGPLALLGGSRLERFLRLASAAPADAESVRFMSRLIASMQAAEHSAGDGARGRVPAPFGMAQLAGGQVTPQTLGYYYMPAADNAARYLLAIRVYPKFTFDSLAAVSVPLEHTRAAVRAAAAPFRREFSVGLTGRPVLSADEMRITTHDTNRAEIVAMLVVVAGLVIMLRSLWLAVVAGVSLATAIGWTFGYAAVSVGQLNLLSTVFVIALIGIGMDYLIQIVVRYRVEARRYERQRAVWARVFRYASPPVLTACGGASGAFFVAAFTNFKGAAELGIIAGGGLLLCVLAGYTVLPAILVLRPPKLRMYDVENRYRHKDKPPRAGLWKFGGLAVWLAVLGVLLPWGMKLKFDPNLLDLQAPGLESVKLVRKLPTWYAVVLSKKLDALAPVNARLNAAAAVAHSPIGSTSSLLNAIAKQKYLAAHTAMVGAIKWTRPRPIVPGDLPGITAAAWRLYVNWQRTSSGRVSAKDLAGLHAAVQALSVANTTHTPAEASAAAGRLSDWQRQFVRELKQSAAMLCPPALNVQKLPPALRAHYMSADGTYALYVYPRFDLWRQHNLELFVHALAGQDDQGLYGAGLVPASMDLTGIAPNIYYSTKAIRHAFIGSSIAALALVIVLVFLDLRSVSQTLMTISVLGLGLPMLVCLMGLLGLNWNFANFFGLPILIGAGHEYGVFMMHRYREAVHNPRRVWRFWDVSERALLLCAFVTCSSFGFLSLARDRGIASLGQVMALGIFCIYLAAIFVLRPLLHWRLHVEEVYDANGLGA